MNALADHAAEVPASHAASRSGRYLPGLDGLRALAVLAVLAYHSSLGVAPAGFLGVEVFFVISGFIITQGLAGERESHGRIRLRSFWARRARRLLPALFLMLAAVLAYEEIFEPEAVAGMRADLVAALGYFTNWHLIVDDQSYFDTFARPPLLRHLWSLAIEEQFYIAWPLVLSLALAWFRPGVARGLVFGGAVASALLMVLLWAAGFGVSRVYYGTDTRLAGLLAGATLALFTGRGPELPGRLRKTGRLLGLGGIGALGLLALTVFATNDSDTFLYRGGFAMVDAASALAVLAAIQQRGRFPAVLGSQPLRWIGLRSYGIYLWHWPIFVLTGPDAGKSLDNFPLVCAQVAATFAIAAASYRWLEVPVRQGALGRLVAGARDWQSAPRWRQGVVALAPVVSLAGVAGLVMGAAVSEAPATPAYFGVRSVRVAAALPAADSGGALPGTPAGGPLRLFIPGVIKDSAETVEGEQGESQYVLGSPPRPQPPTPAATPVPLPPPPVAAPPSAPPPRAAVLVTAIGDSVMLGAAQQMVESIPGVDVDAAVSRAMINGIGLLRERAASGQLGAIVVVHLGNNGPISDGQIDEIFAVTGDERRVVFINLTVPRDWEGPNNEVIARGVARHRNAVLIDWHAATQGRPDVFWTDGMHLRPEGAAFYVGLLRPYTGGH